jgi:hypothetical protein
MTLPFEALRSRATYRGAGVVAGGVSAARMLGDGTSGLSKK